MPDCQADDQHGGLAEEQRVDTVGGDRSCRLPGRHRGHSPPEQKKQDREQTGEEEDQSCHGGSTGEHSAASRPELQLILLPLQVDMVDRRIRSTSLDHSLDIEEMMPSSSPEVRADAVLRPIAGLSVTKIE